MDKFFSLNIDLFSVGLVIAANILLGFTVYFSNKKSISGHFLFLFSLISSIWGTFNYLLYQFQDPFISLWFIRLVMFTAIWQAYSFFLLANVYPDETITQKNRPKPILLLVVSLVALLTLTPLVFSQIISVGNENSIAPKAAGGPGLIIFGVVAIGLVIAGISKILAKRKGTLGTERKQYNFFLLGAVLMFTLIIFFNFIFANLSQNYNFIPLGAAFILPFIISTAYGILKHHMFSAKIIATEIITFFLLVITLLEVILAKNSTEIVFRVIIFLILLVVSILLLRSVRKEVKQREQLQILSKQLSLANEKLKALDQARAEFISIASHQLRTPPSTVKWFLSAILSGDYGKVPEDIKVPLQKTERTNNHLISLIEDMLNVSRIERGKMEFLFEPTDIQDLARQAFEQLEPIAKEKGLGFKFAAVTEKIPNISADKEKIRQVMNNLMDNAIKYSVAGEIIVDLKQEGRKLVFSVKDSGKGINAKDKVQIFKKFSRGKESIKSSAGLGLGLYVAKIVIEQHQGKIWAESEGEGKGSTFYFSIPMDAKKSAGASFDFTAD